MSERIHAFGENGELSDGAELALEDFLITKVNPAISEVMSDSGLRRITPGLNTDPDNHEIFVARQGNLVTLAINRIALTVTSSGVPNNDVLKIPQGFRPSPRQITCFLWTGTGNPRSTFLQTNGNVQLYGGTEGDFLRSASPFVYYTTDPWPTTLPGTPA